MSCASRIGESAKTALNEALNDIKTMTHKYPLVAVISAVAFGILGMSQITAFSITALLSGIILTAISGAIVYSIIQDPAAFFEEIKKSLDLLSESKPREGEEASSINQSGYRQIRK